MVTSKKRKKEMLWGLIPLFVLKKNKQNSQVSSIFMIQYNKSLINFIEVTKSMSKSYSISYSVFTESQTKTNNRSFRSSKVS